jgi:HPt (histidine-containing phosphotransfer) domain-containing protein
MLNFVMKQMVKRQIKDMPKDQQEMIMTLIDENPELLKTISGEIQAKVKKGIDQQTAMMQVMMDHKDELQRAMMKYKK